VTASNSVAMKEPTREQKLEQLARSWDASAHGYDAYFVPRFAAWVEDAVGALDRPLPEGPIIVPCCGTGPELVALAKGHPNREIIGIDLSPGMAELARLRARAFSNVSVVVADASITRHWGNCAAVLSVFGLQQLPEPVLGLRAWAAAVADGGVVTVVYWPEIVETEGPFAWIRQSLVGRAPMSFAWEAGLAAAIADGGCSLVSDEFVSHDMRHANAEEFWNACLDSGPGRSLACRGDAFMREVREAYFSLAPLGPLHHHPRARHLVALRGADL